MDLEQGDAFERVHADWIRQELPYYEPLWSAFIGHSGHGRPLKIPGLPTEKEQRRKKLYQAHYSAAVSCYQINDTLKEIESKLGEVKDISSFLREHRHLHCFMSLIGHVRDMYKQMDEALGLKEAAFLPLQDFYALRSHILHGPRMPVRIVDGFIQIPLVAKQNKALEEWDDKSFWEDFDDSTFVFIADFCEQTRSDFFSIIRDQHAKIYSAACEFFGDFRVEEEKHSSPSLMSASMAFPAISAWIEPSGTYKG